MHHAPRFGHSNRVGKLISSNPEDAIDYTRGVSDGKKKGEKKKEPLLRSLLWASFYSHHSIFFSILPPVEIFHMVHPGPVRPLGNTPLGVQACVWGKESRLRSGGRSVGYGGTIKSGSESQRTKASNLEKLEVANNLLYCWRFYPYG